MSAQLQAPHGGGGADCSPTNRGRFQTLAAFFLGQRFCNKVELPLWKGLYESLHNRMEDSHLQNHLAATDLARHRKPGGEHRGDFVGASLPVADPSRAAAVAKGYRHWSGDRTAAALPVSVTVKATGLSTPCKSPVNCTVRPRACSGRLLKCQWRYTVTGRPAFE